MERYRRRGPVFFALALAGCGGGASDQADASESAVCPGVPADYGDRGGLAVAVAERRNQPGSMGAAHTYYMLGALDGAPADKVSVELWDGFGVFADGVAAAGTYTIAGAEANYDDCGVCVLIDVGVDADGVATRTFLAQSGTVVIDSTVDTFAGSVADLALIEVDPGSGAPVAAGCVTSLGSASFTSPITIVGGGGGGGGGLRARRSGR